MKKLLIIDSNSILNRAFYGIRYLSAKDGTPTNAVYGFLNILMKLVDEEKPDYICAAFDLKAPTFRHKMYSEYKAQRKPTPEALTAQMPIAKEVLNSMNIKILQLEGYEADDIIGTVSEICEKNEIECMIATGDKDDLQLASDKTKVILTVTKSGVNETTVYDAEAVKERYHVMPPEFVDVKALMGDASDNIPGVKGIGEKTAVSLIEKYKSIEYIYENIDGLDIKGAVYEKLKTGKESAFLSKKLAEIDRNVPISFSVDECEIKNGSIAENASDALYEVLKRLELNSIIKRLGVTEKKDEAFFEKFQMLNEPFEPEPNSTIACGFRFDGDTLARAAIACGNKVADIDVNEKNMQYLKTILEDENIRKVVFDIKNVLVKAKDLFEIKNIIYDVAIAAYLIDPAKSDYTISLLAEEYLNVECNEETGQLSLFDEDNSFLRETACIIPLMEKTAAKIKADGQYTLFADVELPLVNVLADMQIAGIKIDKEQLAAFSDMLSVRIEKLEEEIYSLAGEKFNINSPKQLGIVLFEKLGMKSVKKTKSGYSTNAEVLEKLKDKHPIVPLVTEYRQVAKLKSTYCDGLSAVIEEDGRIHSNFTQTVTVTGRISSTEPNMQNIPVRTELGRELRKMFVAKDGCVLIDADYSQIELRVLAAVAEDGKMISAFENDEDIHTVTAAQVLGIDPSEVTSEQRSRAKAVNFGIVYGIGEYSLSQDIHVSVKEAKQYIENYLDKYSGVKAYMEHVKKQAAEDGYVKTLMNRVRYIPELKSSNFNIRAFGERVALNTPIQGTAADIIKLAMVRVHKRLEEEKMQSRLILQVHDELIIEAPEEEKEKAAKILREEMENAISLKVPLKADLSMGKSWYEAK